jgi:hypothetical protein
MKTTRFQQTQSLLLNDHVVRISECWKKSTDSIVELSLACCKANKELNSRSKKQLVTQLPFCGATFCKYAQIGNDPRLTDPERRHLLPAKMSALYELHQFADDEFQALEAEGLLTPRLRRADVTRWVKNRRGESQKSASGLKLPGGFYAALKPNRQLASTESSKVDAALTELAERFEMDVVYPETKPRCGASEKALRQMRQAAKKIVAEENHRRRKQAGPEKFKNRPELRKYAGFFADEVKIEPGADSERILEVLTTLGREDEFEAIRIAAYNEHQPDESFDAPAWMDTVADRPPPAAALAADMEEVKEQLQAIARTKPSLEQMKGRLAGVK